MVSANKATAKVGIAIGFGPVLQSSLGEEGVAEIKREVTCYLEGVASDLCTSDLFLLVPQIEVRDTSASALGFDVTINAVPCRVPLSLDQDALSAPSPRALASRIAQIIHVNRELLVDARIAEAFRAALYSERPALYLPGLSRAAFLDYLRLLLLGCFNLAKGLSVDNRLPQWTAQACYEETAALSDLRCLLSRPPGAAARSDVDDEPIERLLELMQEGLFYELGIRLPQVQMREDTMLREAEFRIQINDLRLPPATGLRDGEFLVNDGPGRLRLLGIEGRAAANPATGAAAAIVTGGAEVARNARDTGLTTWGRVGYTVLALSRELRRHAPAYIVSESVEHDLHLLKDWYPDVIKSALDRFGAAGIVQVLRSLADEGISIRNLVGVLGAMLAVKSTVEVDFGKHIVFQPYATQLCPAVLGKNIGEVEPTGYAECVRSQFKEYISHKYTRGQSTLIVYLLNSALESRVAKSRMDPLTSQEKMHLVEKVQEELRRLPSAAQIPVILTTVEVRKLFRRLIEVEFPNLAVLAYQELSPSLNIQPIGTIGRT
jgi:hypothetical protein